MDISTTLNKNNSKQILSKKVLQILSLMLFLSSSVWALLYSNSAPKVLLSDVRTAEVMQGNFKVKVQGFGRLESKHQRLLTSQSQAIVENIHLYPGARVRADTTVLTLLDPALAQAVINARLSLARQQAEYKESVIAHNSQIMERNAQISLLTSELANSKLHAEAEEQLFKKGIVSTLDYKRTLLDVEQLNQRIEIEKARLENLKAMQQEQINIQKDLITQYQSNFTSVQNQFDQLKVKAGLDGVLQTVPVEIGQSVNTGTLLASVGSEKKLVAHLSVPHRQADQVVIGMQAVVNTFGNTIKAEVIRIDPIVTEGRVIVELDLLGELPANARPDLTVEGHILVNEITDALYIKQPAKVDPFKQKKLFRIDKKTQTAHLVAVEFGTMSGNQIQVINGAQSGDNFIISDMSPMIHEPSVQLKK